MDFTDAPVVLSERQLLEIITQAQAGWLQDCQNPRLFPRLLDALLALTDSEYGFIGEVEQTPSGPPYLRMRAFTNIAWSEPLRRRYPAEDAAGIEFHHLDNLFGAVITGGVPVIANAPAQDPRSKGLPAGHPPLHAFLGLPLDSGGRQVGVAGVANRPGGYDEALARALQPFLATCAHLIHAQRLDTQRRQAEAAAQEAYDDLQKSHADLLAILDHLRVGVVVLDADGRVVFLSESGGSLLALHRQSVLGRAWEAAFPFDAESRERLQRLLTAPASARVPIPLTWSLAERACWLEGEVQDDPRHPNQRLVYLYDQSEVQRLRCHLRQARHGDLIGTSEPMRRLYELIERVAPGDWTVLIEGETGVGKELVAHAIHAASPRAHRPFITVNCAGLDRSAADQSIVWPPPGRFHGGCR